MNNLAEKLPELEQERALNPAKPFAKWVGGKRQLLPELLSRVPSSYGTYYEPFTGGGAMFFALQPKRAVLSDVISDLVTTYNVIRNKVEPLIKHLQTQPHNKEYFYQLRDADRSPAYEKWKDVEIASRFIYLNRTCFNGLYRVNSKGQFNTPFGDYKSPTICDAENLRRCSKALQSAVIHEAPFERSLKHVKEDDFVYFDPPYVPLNKTSSFTSYSDGGFSLDQQRKLLDTCKMLNARGAKFMLSNSYTDFTLGLYKDFKIDRVLASRAINSKADKRGKIYEILVSNY